MSIRSEMLLFAGNNQNIKMFGVPPPPPPPPEHFAICYVHNDNLPRGRCITICHSKQLQEGLMVFSNDFLHFLKIKIFFLRIHQNYIVALRLHIYTMFNGGRCIGSNIRLGPT